MKKFLQPVEVGGSDYEVVGASAAAQVLGTAGALNDFLARLIVTVSTPATATLSITDGAGAAIPIVPANTVAGVYVVEIGVRSVSGPWKVTTGAGLTAVAVGQFSI